jgi:spoIIIJ-associated protein
MLNEDIEKIKEIIKEVVGKLGITIDVIENDINTTTLSPRFVIKTKESSLLIGANGANLVALNYLIKRIIAKTKKEELRFFIDVNDYHIKLEEDLKNRAKMMADRAVSLKVDVSMDPMSSYERMIVHSILQNYPNIKTESVGVGKERHIVIRYKEEEL